MPLTAAPEGGAAARPLSLSESARLHDLSYDLRAIHSALLPPVVIEVANTFNSLPRPSSDEARTVLKTILESTDSLLDALLACRMVEGALQLAVQSAQTADDANSLRQDFDSLITMLAGRLSLNALNTVLKADALGNLRGLVRAYRMERVALEAPPVQLPPSSAVDKSVAAPWRQWLSHPLALPRRNPHLALAAIAMVLALPVAGVFATSSGVDPAPLWTGIGGLMATASVVAVLSSPFRQPAQRGAANKADAPPPSAAPSHPRSASKTPGLSLARQEASLRRQGVDVVSMDDAALIAWIETSGGDIAALLKTARTQSLAANIATDDDED